MESTIIAKYVVAPQIDGEVTPIDLGPLDLAQPIVHIELTFVLESINIDKFLGKSLQDLVNWCPLLSGRVSSGTITFPEDHGVLAVHAECQCSFEESGLPKASKPFIPEHGGRLFAVQVTKLSDSNSVVCVLADHQAMDFEALCSVISVWRNFYAFGIRKEETPPVISRNVFGEVNVINTDRAIGYAAFTPDILATWANSPLPPMEFASIRFDSKSINNEKYTNHDIITAIIWRAVCRARGCKNEAKLLIPVNIRNRVDPKIPKNYIGNCVVTTAVLDDIILTKSLDQVCNIVKSLRIQVDNIYTHEILSFLKSEINDGKIIFPGLIPKEPGHLLLSSWARCPISDLTFDEKTPIFVGPISDSSLPGIGIILPKKKDDSTFIVSICVEKGCSERLEYCLDMGEVMSVY